MNKAVHQMKQLELATYEQTLSQDSEKFVEMERQVTEYKFRVMQLEQEKNRRETLRLNKIRKERERQEQERQKKQEWQDLIVSYDCDWKKISYNQSLSEDFIREFQDSVDWICISYNQTLSEDFIREFQDRVNWSNISIYQNLSEDFIREFKDKVDWEDISDHQNLSEDFKKEFYRRLYRSLLGYHYRRYD